jgi:RNA recognition motif-containing protein
MTADDLANAQVPDLKMDMLSQSVSSNSQPLLSTHSLSNSSNISNSSYTKRVSCYVGNLTWWTTDKDLFDAITSLAITDIIEIKFYENKINGQSKGFASVTVGSDQSFRTIMDKLPKSQLNGQEPIVTNYNRHYLNQFEEQARKDMPNSGQAGNNSQANNAATGLLNSSQPQFEHQNMSMSSLLLLLMYYFNVSRACCAILFLSKSTQNCYNLI